VSPWLLAALGLMPPLAGAALVAAQGLMTSRLVALPFATALMALVLLCLTMAENQPSFVDLALALVLVGYPGTLVYAYFAERWL
jgi:multisubunit Na+/H+ antiporter MnhF subunit